jgi:hypothetical protein
VHKTYESVLVAYVDHHDAAYAWAERRRIEAHPRTGAIQIVEIRERVDEVPASATLDFVFQSLESCIDAAKVVFAKRSSWRRCMKTAALSSAKCRAAF